MASTLHNEPPDTAWRAISADSDRLLELTAHSSPSTSTHNKRSFESISVDVLFPAPPDIASDFVSLGIRIDIAHNLSADYLRAIHNLRDTYEKQYNLTNEACTQIAAVASGALIPDLLIRLQKSFVSKYANLQRSWAQETLTMTQKFLLSGNLKSERSLTVRLYFLVSFRRLTKLPLRYRLKNVFASLSMPYRQTLLTERFRCSSMVIEICIIYRNTSLIIGVVRPQLDHPGSVHRTRLR